MNDTEDMKSTGGWLVQRKMEGRSFRSVRWAKRQNDMWYVFHEVGGKPVSVKVWFIDYKPNKLRFSVQQEDPPGWDEYIPIISPPRNASRALLNPKTREVRVCFGQRVNVKVIGGTVAYVKFGIPDSDWKTTQSIDIPSNAGQMYHQCEIARRLILSFIRKGETKGT